MANTDDGLLKLLQLQGLLEDLKRDRARLLDDLREVGADRTEKSLELANLFAAFKDLSAREADLNTEMQRLADRLRRMEDDLLLATAEKSTLTENLRVANESVGQLTFRQGGLAAELKVAEVAADKLEALRGYLKTSLLRFVLPNEIRKLLQ